jgi:hypothetical protein
MYAQYNITNNRLFLWTKTPSDSKGVKLEGAEYQRTRDVRMQHWPRGCFTCLWSPQAEDLLIEMAGEIVANDEPDNLEHRADRYSKYADKAEDQAEGANGRILSGRAHTDRQLRQAESSSKTGTDKALYWHQRIEGSIRAAAYKDVPEVIVRRIQGIERDMRKYQNYLDRNYSPAIKANAQRWMDHLKMRHDYETTYLDAVGGDPRKQVEDVGIGDVVMYHQRECEVLSAGRKNLLICDTTGSRQVGREEVDGIVRRAEVKAKSNIRRRAAPDDGIKKGVMVTWKKGWQSDAPQFTSKVISCGTLNLKVERPVDDPQYIKHMGYADRPLPAYFKTPVEVMRRDAKLAEVAHA